MSILDSINLDGRFADEVCDFLRRGNANSSTGFIVRLLARIRQYATLARADLLHVNFLIRSARSLECTLRVAMTHGADGPDVVELLGIPTDAFLQQTMTLLQFMYSLHAL